MISLSKAYKANNSRIKYFQKKLLDNEIVKPWGKTHKQASMHMEVFYYGQIDRYVRQNNMLIDTMGAKNGNIQVHGQGLRHLFD